MSEASIRHLPDRVILRTTEDLVAPEHSVVLVVDMQNAICSPDGPLARQGVDVTMMAEILPPMARLLDAARQHRVPIVFARALVAPNQMSVSAPYLKFLHGVLGGATPDWLDGTWEGEIVPELGRRSDEPVVVKYRSSAFVNTNLDTLLRSMGTKTVIVVGEQTPGCVEATVRGAADHDYYPVIVTDCVGSLRRDLHDASMKVMTARWDSASSVEIVEIWRRSWNGERERRAVGLGPDYYSVG